MSYRTSITPDEIDAYIHDWPKDRYIVRPVNGRDGQGWAVCDEKTWNIITLSYTEAEATAIAKQFNVRRGKS